MMLCRPETNRYTPEETGRILKELRELVEESVKLASSTGPRGITRGVQAVRALVSLTQEYLTAGKLDEPPVILRKLFERLGATYIKLGQFIASSPSLFPEEYVLEFQKCLDQTEPVPFSRIKKTIEEELSVPIDQVRELLAGELQSGVFELSRWTCLQSQHLVSSGTAHWWRRRTGCNSQVSF